MRPLAVDVEWRTSDGVQFSPGTAPLGLVERLSRPKASPRTSESVEYRLKRAEERRQVRGIAMRWKPFIRAAPCGRCSDWAPVPSVQEFSAKRYQSKAHRTATADAAANESAPSTPGIDSTEPSAILRQRRERAELFLIRRRAVEQARRERAAAAEGRLVEAEQRRALLQDLERERLKQEHQLVLQRLVSEEGRAGGQRGSGGGRIWARSSPETAWASADPPPATRHPPTTS